LIIWNNYTGYSLNLTILENLVNAVGTNETNYTSDLGWTVWNNYTGTSTGGDEPLSVINPNPGNNSNNTISYSYGVNTSITVIYLPNIVGNYLNISMTSNSSGAWIEYFSQQISGNGTYYTYNMNFSQPDTYFYWNTSVWNDTFSYINSTWSFKTGPSSNYTIIENIVNATGLYTTSYTAGNGLYVWNNYTGNTTSITLFENIFNATGTHSYVLTPTGYDVWANYTGFSINLTILESLISAHGTHDSSYNNGTGWLVWNNYTANGTELVIYNVMPPNRSLVLVNVSGVNVSFSIMYDNYTIGDSLNATFYSNSSGSWLPFGSSTITSNGTYYASNENFTNVSEIYYWRISVNNGSRWWNESYWFEASSSGYEMSWLSFVILGAIPLFVRRKRQNDR
jgi:hypothetical protein